MRLLLSALLTTSTSSLVPGVSHVGSTLRISQHHREHPARAVRIQLLAEQDPKNAAANADPPPPQPQPPRQLSRLEVFSGAVDDEAPLSFASLGVTTPGVADNLAAANITQPNALQLSAFGPIVGGRDVILHAWTGSGKTLAFLLPLIERLDATSREPQVLVLCPSRELAFQILRVAQAALAGSGLSAAGIVGGANPNRQLEKIKKTKPQLLVGTPGRVAELAFDWKKLKLQRVRHVVLDEVDDGLRPPHLEYVQRLLESVQDGRPLQLVFASATADTPPVRRSAVQLLQSPLLLRLRPGTADASTTSATAADSSSDDGGDGGAGEAARSVEEALFGRSDGDDDSASTLGAQLPSSIIHGVVIIPPNKGLQAVHSLHHSKPSPKCLVFVNSPHRAKVVCERLWESYGIPAAPLHGELEREERVDIMRRILDGRVRITVCTEMGARGLDIPGLTHVVNLELPTDASHYVHRAGRCGRAGADGTVLSLVPPQKAFVVGKLTKRLGVPLVDMAIKGGKVQITTSKAARSAASRTSTSSSPAGRKDSRPKPRSAAGRGSRRRTEQGGAGAASKRRPRAKRPA